MNLRMLESKSSALPLGDTPKSMGRVMGIEPTTSRTTILRSNQLSYTRRLVRLKGFEPLTLGLEGRCSIQLSYRCIVKVPDLEFCFGAGDGNRTHAASLEGWNSTIELHPHTFLINNAYELYQNVISMSTVCKIFFKFLLKKNY